VELVAEGKLIRGKLIRKFGTTARTEDGTEIEVDSQTLGSHPGYRYCVVPDKDKIGLDATPYDD
jgi:hypothetical protein